MKNDYFSTQSDAYKAFRPAYPKALAEVLCRDLDPDALIWDCATGNGQAARLLAGHAAIVIASDQSMAQLKNAISVENVRYIQAIAEKMPLADASVDLITVAQALHWFDFERFYAEARRVLKPGGRVAAWTYSFLSVSAQLGVDIDTVVRSFYHDVVGPYWPPERRWVDDEYCTIPFPFRTLDLPSFSIEVNWSLDALLGYLASWSATQRYRDASGRDPMPSLRKRLLAHWGAADTARQLVWPMSIRFGALD